MSDEFYTFIVTSTINAGITHNNVFDNDVRYNQTLETLDSIHKHVPNVKILLIDNSIEPLTEEQTKELESKVDVLHKIDHNVVTLFFNKAGLKGDGEIYMMYEAMKLLRHHDMIGSRIFKLSGRYKLADTFSLDVYGLTQGNYVGRINQWDASKDAWNTKETIWYFETRLWSFCGSCFDEFEQLIPTIFAYMTTVDNNLEKAYLRLLPQDKIMDLKPIHVEGYTADTGIIKIE